MSLGSCKQGCSAFIQLHILTFITYSHSTLEENMKLYKFFALTTLVMAFAACDPVDENERYSEAKEINKERKVLIEEFTGQFCPNCPLGHEALDKIKEAYGENAVIVSIHAGELAYQDPQFGLKTDDGDKYAAAWGIQAYPSAVVNRNGKVSDNRSEWQGEFFKSAIMSPKVKIALNASIKDGKVYVSTSLTSTANEVNGKLQLWVTEDNITAVQMNDSEYILDYVHNHVYRASVNGIGGESVSFGNDGITKENSIDLASNWNKENINIVAFVYDESGVLQAEETKIK